MSGDALAGVRVLDLSRVLAGPWATQTLADLGADVWKVEHPDGDGTRHWGPPFDRPQDDSPPQGTYHLAANRNKRSLAVDWTKPGGADLVRQLVAGADIVVENFLPGALEAHGLGPDAMMHAHASLVWCSITGFGRRSPLAARPGYDFMIQAESGLMELTGEPDGRPLRVGVAIADLVTGMQAATAILAALRHAEATGEGQHIDMALFDCTLAALANQATGWLNAGAAPRRLGNAHPTVVPYETFRTADGTLALAIGNDRQFARLARLLAEPGWACDPRFATGAARVEHRDALRAKIEHRLAARTTDCWLDLLEAESLPAGRVATLMQAFAGPAARARGLVVEQADPRLGMVRTPASPLALGLTPPAYRRPPPRLGGHGRELLAEAGLSAAEVDALAATGAVALPDR